MTSCIFCRIIKGEIQTTKIFEDKNFLVFHDKRPKAPIHILIVPKNHIEQPVSIKLDKKTEKVLGGIFTLGSRMAKKLGVDKTGWRLSQNNGPFAGQEIKHFHLHFMAGKKLE